MKMKKSDIIAFVVIGIVIIVFIVYSKNRREDIEFLRQNGEIAIGEIVRISTIQAEKYCHYVYNVGYQTYKGSFTYSYHFQKLRPGYKVKISYDPEDPSRSFVYLDERDRPVVVVDLPAGFIEALEDTSKIGN